jgi:hypothetical protein
VLKFLFQLFFIAPVGIDTLDIEFSKLSLALQPSAEGYRFFLN